MTPLPKHLEEIGQSLAREYDAQEAEHLDKSEAIAYLKGFEEAASIMLKDMESMAKALNKAENVGEIKFCTNIFAKQVAEEIAEALKIWREKYGESNEQD